MKKALQIGMLVFTFLLTSQVAFSKSNFSLNEDSTHLPPSIIISIPYHLINYSSNQEQIPFFFKHFKMNQAAEPSSNLPQILFHNNRPVTFPIASLNPIQPSKSIGLSQPGKQTATANQVSEPLDSRFDSFVSMGLPLFVFGIFSALALVLFGRVIYSLIKAIIARINAKRK